MAIWRGGETRDGAAMERQDSEGAARGADTLQRNEYMGSQNCLPQEWGGTSGWDQFTLPLHDFLHQTDLEHCQAISGILFTIRWNYDWHTDTSSCT